MVEALSGFDRSILRAELARDEGRVPYAYADSLGFWTIGVGHLIDKRKGGRLPEPIIDALLDIDIDEKTGDLDVNIPWWRSLDDVRQRVLLNMCFNMGWAGLGGFTNTLQAIKERRWADAASGMRTSLWAKQVPERAERLAKAMASGVVS